ncbi:MAG: hypothetical protein ACYCT6_09955 [bacterium]|jgi:hypothetical protein
MKSFKSFFQQIIANILAVAFIFIISITFHTTISKNMAILYLGHATFNYAIRTKKAFIKLSTNKKTYKKFIYNLKALSKGKVITAGIDASGMAKNVANDKKLSSIMINYYKSTYKFAKQINFSR